MIKPHDFVLAGGVTGLGGHAWEPGVGIFALINEPTPISKPDPHDPDDEDRYIIETLTRPAFHVNYNTRGRVLRAKTVDECVWFLVAWPERDGWSAEHSLRRA